MAIQKVIDLPIKREERTDEVVIHAPLGKGYHVRVLRVTRDFFQTSPPVEVSRRWIERNMAQLMTDPDAIPLLSGLPALFDRWATEDDAAAAVAAAAAAAVAATAATAAAAAAAP